MNKSFKISTLLLSSLLMTVLIIAGCKKEDDENPVDTSTAKVEGVVHSPNGHVIGAAKIYAAGKITKSNSSGQFKLEIPGGIHTLVIQTGSGHLFKTTLNINVIPGQQLILTPQQSELKQVGSLAFIPGQYDRIEDIIIDSLGYFATPISVYDLDNITQLSTYDALFLNCGLMEMAGAVMNAQRYANLQTYLENHGSIYASDYAVELLTGDGYLRPSSGDRNHSKPFSVQERNAELTSQCMSPMPGGFLEDSSLCTSKSGPITFVQGADILDQDIVLALGASTVNINYDLGMWEHVNSYGPPMNVIINDGNAFGPLALRSDPFSEGYGGIIFYTTFHNEPQGYISPSVKTILQYFILNL